MRNASTFFLSLVVLAGAAAFLSACNTTAGAGKDVSEIGHTVTDTADKHK
jgi:predicted small secreted protein